MIKIKWSCSDIAHHEHRTKAGAAICGYTQRLRYYWGLTEDAETESREIWLPVKRRIQAGAFLWGMYAGILICVLALIFGGTMR